MKHATVKLDGKDIPLIGIDPKATLERCALCHNEKHIQQVKLDVGGSIFVCSDCIEAVKRGELRP